MRVGTRKTIFTFYFIVAFYLMALWSVKDFNALIPPEALPAPGAQARMSWLAPFHPVLALFAVSASDARRSRRPGRGAHRNGAAIAMPSQILSH